MSFNTRVKKLPDFFIKRQNDTTMSEHCVRLLNLTYYTQKIAQTGIFVFYSRKVGGPTQERM